MKKRNKEQVVKEAQVVRYILEKGYLKLPVEIMSNRSIERLNHAILTKDPRKVSSFFLLEAESIGKNKGFKFDDLKILFNYLSYQKKEINSKHPDILTQTDKKILDWLKTSSEVKLEDFLELIGPFYFIIDALKELKELEDLKPNFEATRIMVLFWNFQSIYELILYVIDRRLFNYIKHCNNILIKQDKNVKRFMEKDREGGNAHAELGFIRSSLFKVLNITENKPSILSQLEKPLQPGKIRNYLAHSNVFYDRVRKKIIFLHNIELTTNEFIVYFYQLFQFMVVWLEGSIQVPIEKANKYIKKKIQEAYEGLSKMFYDFAYHSISMRYRNRIIQLEEEAKKEYGGQKLLNEFML